MKSVEDYQREREELIENGNEVDVFFDKRVQAAYEINEILKKYELEQGLDDFWLIFAYDIVRKAKV